MPKGHVRDFIGLYRAILADVTVYHPTLLRDCSRDLSRLISLFEKHGDAVFTVHLPALGKVLDLALDEGRLVRTGLPLSRSINTRTVIPRLFRGIWLRIFSIDGCLKQDIDPNDVLFLRTLYSASKKYRKDCAPHRLFLTTKEYFDVDSSLPPPSLNWDGDGSDLSHSATRATSLVSELCGSQEDLFGRTRSSDSHLFGLVQLVADRVSALIGDFVPSESRFRHGPGAVSDITTGGGYKYSFPGWSPRLQFVFPAEVFAIANTSILAGWNLESEGMPRFVETSSRLIAVPKTQKSPRLIAAEPTCNQWTQQCVRDFLDTRIRSTILGKSIDFRRQDFSRDAARTASQSGKFATVDLSAASDRLSCWLVERMFRNNIPLLRALMVTRTRYVSNDIDKKLPTLHKLKKFSSMGSALTFPVQSIVFYILCVAAGLSCSPPRTRWQSVARQVRVYGDDLIVPVSWMPRVEYILSSMYLKVNRSKTFSAGNFRESCGMDAFRGHDVTPAYFLEHYSESKTSTLISLVDVSNNLLAKGFWHTAQWVQSSIPQVMKQFIPVVAASAGLFGFHSFSGTDISSRNRWNKHLQRWEFLAWRLLSRRQVGKHEGFSNLLQYFTEDPSQSDLSDWESGLFGKPLTVLSKGWVPVP